MIKEMNLDQVKDPVTYIANFLSTGIADDTVEAEEYYIEEAERLLYELGDDLTLTIGVITGYYEC